jgi:hypothetical protein
MVQGVKKMLVLYYENKNALKECIGKPLDCRDPSANYQEIGGMKFEFGGQSYKSNGTVFGCNRPHITGYKKEFFAEIVMENDLIKEVK